LRADHRGRVDRRPEARGGSRDDDVRSLRGGWRSRKAGLVQAAFAADRRWRRVDRGSFGVWSGADQSAQKIILKREDRPRITPEQAEAIRARQLADRKAAEADLLRRQETAARKAGGWWRKCGEIGESAYLSRKGLPAGRLFGARLSPTGNLVIPVQDGKGKTWGLQVVYHDPAIKKRKGRDKDFCPAGLAKKGHFFLIGSPMAGSVALLCEGFATGASLHEATGLPVVVAFDAGNLLPVAQAVCKTYRGLRLLVCADDDYLQTCRACSTWTTVADPECTACGEAHGKGNAGVESAQSAALAVGGHVATPIFPGQRPLTHKGPTDFNDLHVHPDGGLSMVARQIEASLSAHGWQSGRQRPVRAAADEAGGGAATRLPMRGLYSLDEACERWTLLYGADGAFFDSVEHVIVKKADVLALIPDHAARDWKLRPDRKVARFSEVGFDPTEKDTRVVCNLWGGWPTTPKAGDCQILLDLLQWMCSLESNSREAYDWALRWLAYPLQHHGAKMKTTLVFHGMQGAGKNIFFDAIASLYGEYGGTVDQSAVESQFNDWASRKLMLIFDEVVARNELYFLKNRIKSLITGDTIRINPKNLSAWQERNHCNGVWLSNELHPTAVELFDRRHFMIWTPQALSPAFYKDVAACLAWRPRGAAPLPRQSRPWRFRRAQQTADDGCQARRSGAFHGLDRAVLPRLAGRRDALPGLRLRLLADLPGLFALVRGLRREAEEPEQPIGLPAQATWLADRPQRRFRRRLLRRHAAAHAHGDSRRVRRCRQRGATRYRKAADKTEAQWATDCFFSFHGALGGDD
jgi:putative DNA primase/helicase